MSGEPKERAAHWEGYQLGVLAAYQFLAEGHGQTQLAADVVNHLLPVGPKDIGKLKALAKREGVTVNWADVEHAREYR